jgi:hypothetical protein
MRNTERNNQAAEQFVQDNYYEPGHLGYKAIQTLAAIGTWIILLFPLLILFNSVSKTHPLPFIYHWSSAEGKVFFTYLTFLTIAGIGVIGMLSIILAIRNNRFETENYAKKKYYDEEKNKARLELMDEIYTERFGDKDLRQNARLYVISPEKNFPKRYYEKKN